MGFYEVAARVWASLHEPRTVTALVVGLYAATGIVGAVIVLTALDDVRSWIPDGLAFMTGGLMVTAALVGVPSTWRGHWWLERGATLLLALAGAALTAGSGIAMWQHPQAVDLPIAWAAIFGGIVTIHAGVNRWLRVGLDPYAPGRGPLTPQRRIDQAQTVMEAQQREALTLCRK